MAAERFIIPQSPLVGPDDRARTEWTKYLGGIETLSKRLNGIEPLDGAATLADIRAKINEILAASQTE